MPLSALLVRPHIIELLQRMVSTCLCAQQHVSDHLQLSSYGMEAAHNMHDPSIMPPGEHD